MSVARLRTMVESERGAAVVEYAFLVLLVAIVAITAVVLAGNEVSSQYSSIASSLAGANA